jgi:hypothetical protein
MGGKRRRRKVEDDLGVGKASRFCQGYKDAEQSKVNIVETAHWRDPRRLANVARRGLEVFNLCFQQIRYVST